MAEIGFIALFIFYGFLVAWGGMVSFMILAFTGNAKHIELLFSVAIVCAGLYGYYDLFSMRVDFSIIIGVQ